MSLFILSVGDNPQQPGIVAETYLPDQLIAGPPSPISDGGTVTGAAVLPRGSVMGQAIVSSSPTATAGKAFATDTIQIIAVPTTLDTLTIGNGTGTTVITFLTLPEGQVEEILPPLTQYILATTALQAAALCEFLNSSTDSMISLNTYSVSSSTVTATAKIPGTGGNSYTLATSDTSTFTLGGATFSGGTNNTGTATIGSISYGVDALPGNYVITLFSSTQGYVVNPNGDQLGTTTMGTAFKNPEINFTITTGGSPASGDAFVISSTPLAGAGLWKLSVATATDGSEVPSAILADYCDPTGGNVNVGLYVFGAFNSNAIVVDSSWSVAAVKAACAGRGLFFKGAVTAGDPS